MSDNILDLQDKLNKKKLEDGAIFIYCNVCGDESAGFAVQGRFNHSGAYYIETIVCLSDQCAGETYIDITGGFIV